MLLLMMLHIAWAALLYALLTLLRAPKVWGLNSSWLLSKEVLEARVSANLSNQFEWPLFFHAACIILSAVPALYSPLHWWLGIIFLLGRVAHSAVQILTANIRLRGLVFSVNFFAVISMWCLIASALELG